MTRIAIRFCGFPGAPNAGREFIGQFFETFDHEANGGFGGATFTPDPAKALTLPTMMDAMTFVQRVPASRPLREDLQPNRPMSASTNEVVLLEP